MPTAIDSLCFCTGLVFRRWMDGCMHTCTNVPEQIVVVKNLYVSFSCWQSFLNNTFKYQISLCGKGQSCACHFFPLLLREITDSTHTLGVPEKWDAEIYADDVNHHLSCLAPQSLFALWMQRSLKQALTTQRVCTRGDDGVQLAGTQNECPGIDSSRLDHL